MMERFDLEKAIKITGLENHAENADEGRDFDVACRMVLQSIEEVQAYQAIGTVEEFKSLKEKNEPKKLLTREEMFPQGYGIYSTKDRWCPSCKCVVFTTDWSDNKQKILYKRTRCSCGQKLDWNE